ncbi:hypothetical protein C8R43DRAFT_1241097 [Mycena crocata]|nr:hypothetical protein C8R43DRAFT_1241097 [Mycena crocata]
MRVTIHTEIEPPEIRPCPPIPLGGPLLMEFAPVGQPPTPSLPSTVSDTPLPSRKTSPPMPSRTFSETLSLPDGYVGPEQSIEVLLGADTVSMLEAHGFPDGLSGSDDLSSGPCLPMPETPLSGPPKRHNSSASLRESCLGMMRACVCIILVAASLLFVPPCSAFVCVGSKSDDDILPAFGFDDDERKHLLGGGRHHKISAEVIVGSVRNTNGLQELDSASFFYEYQCPVQHEAVALAKNPLFVSVSLPILSL